MNFLSFPNSALKSPKLTCWHHPASCGSPPSRGSCHSPLISWPNVDSSSPAVVPWSHQLSSCAAVPPKCNQQRVSPHKHCVSIKVSRHNPIFGSTFTRTKSIIHFVNSQTPPSCTALCTRWVEETYTNNRELGKHSRVPLFFLFLLPNSIPTAQTILIPLVWGNI